MKGVEVKDSMSHPANFIIVFRTKVKEEKQHQEHEAEAI